MIDRQLDKQAESNIGLKTSDQAFFQTFKTDFTIIPEFYISVLSSSGPLIKEILVHSFRNENFNKRAIIALGFQALVFL